MPSRRSRSFARHKPLTVSAWNMVIGALVLAPFLPSGIEQAAVASTEGFWAAVYLGIVPSLIAYASWAVALSRLPASRASNFLYCVPPVATLIGFVWLGEVPGPARHHRRRAGACRRRHRQFAALRRAGTKPRCHR